MPLTLRPTGLRQSAAFAHLADYSVYDDGREIGRIYEVHAPTRPEAAWTWSIIVMGEAKQIHSCCPSSTTPRRSSASALCRHG